MDEAFYGRFKMYAESCLNLPRRIVYYISLFFKYSIIHLFNTENKMAGRVFVKGFANPANKSKKVTLKSSKKLNKPKEKVIATDQEDCLLCTGMYSKEEWVACLQCKLWFHDDCRTSFAALGTICDLCL